MDQIKQLLDRIAELSDAELAELENSVVTEFDSVEKLDRTPQTVDSMVELADAADLVKAEKTKRTALAAELSQRADEAAARVRAGAEGDAEAETPAAEVEVEDEVKEEVAVAASAETKPQGEPDEAVADSGVDADTDKADAKAEKAEAKAEAKADKAEAKADKAEAKADAKAEKAEAKTVTDETDPVAPVEAPAETENDTTETVEAPADDADKEGDDPKKEQEGTVTAAAGTPQDIEQPVVTPPADRQARATIVHEATLAITAGADIPGVSAGSPLGDMKAVAKAMADRMHQMRRTSGGDGEQHTVATIVASFPEERTLYANDPEGNKRKIEDVTSQEAITAAGGLCAPVETRYDIFDTGGVTDRPVKSALAPFNADRGGIRFLTPPTLADFEGIGSVWTLQDDIDAATPGAPDPVKPCIRIACGAEVTVFTDALPLCLTFGNLNARAYPELIARHNELALIQQARFAETRLLTRIGSLSTAVTAGRTLSAAIDFLAQVDRAQASYRNRHRLNDVAAMRVIAPQWLKELMRADLSMRMPGDGLEGNLMVADAQIDAFFRARNVNITWTLDGETGQVFGAQAAGPLQSFPSTVVWYMFLEGTFLFLDGGTLDLGLVRDSTLNGTNDYKMFVETFEGVAKVGVESLRVTSTLTPTGMVAGTLDTRPAPVV